MERGYKIATRLGNKKDMCMFLALHMEKSPMCVNPSEKFNKTGIVVCESDKIHKVVAMSCSRENLHAVQHVMLNVPCSLSNCTVYLSRKPCSICTTFLIQGSVSSVYYWPMSPEIKGEDSAVQEDLKQVDQMFLRSNISSSVFLPITDSDTVFKISSRIKIYKCTECSSHYAEAVPKDMEKNSSLLNMQGHIRICAEQMKIALCCLDSLLHCPHGEFEKKEKIEVEKMHTHALQLCYLLAARSDDPDRGVGCILYNQNGYFFGAGYNGYPIGAIFANLPCAGRNIKKESGTAKGPVLIHAEANALLFRSRKKIEENDVLYCTKPPCSECQNYIQFVGIKKIVSVQESTQLSSNQQDSTGSLKSNFEYYQWKPQYAECSASPFSKQTENSEKRDGEETERKNDKGPPPRLPNKEDLCIFLALHMENSPNCQEPSCKYVRNKQKETKFFKTGIVICEANKPKRIITMDCSTEDLHAVPKALLRFPNALRGCEVYLSRMPCISCAKLLIQAQVSQVYYWPNLEIQTTEVNLKNIEMEAEHVDNIFRESYITAAVYIPILDVETVKQRIFPRTGSPPDTKNTTPITSVYDHKRSPKLLEILNLAHITKDKLFQESYRDDIVKAIQSFQTLAGGIDTEIKENNFQEDKHAIQREPKYIHALQLCNLLAARNDSPNTGVGTLIYRKEDIVAVGYNGFPKGTVNSLFSQKDDGSCDQHAIICAEANAIILRTEDDLSDTELITTCEPCSVCENLIKAMKIKKIIWPNRDEKKQPEGATKDPTEEENNPRTESFQVKGSIKKVMSICDEKILALQADREKCNRKDTEGTPVSGEKEGKTMEIQSPADEGHASGQQAILNSSAVSASHRDDIVKEDREKTNPLLTETESELETESLDKPKAANVSSVPPPSQRLTQIRRRKKRTCDEMFSELMQLSGTERAVWRDTIPEYRTVANERGEKWLQEDQRRHDAMLGLLWDQADMLWRLVEVHERQRDHGLPLQPLFNRPPSSPCSIASSPRRPRTRGGGGSGHPTTPPQWTAQATAGWHSISFKVAFSFPPTLLPHPTRATL
ncbi:uncharacterized protein LOC125626659 isoform X2 [Caretta caretta]|uniref:uncharacterized protein LOC125626659 isoform X2 n=1 Tax=Caretta caretta TaxID=8467 RepID=UPI003F4BA116